MVYFDYASTTPLHEEVLKTYSLILSKYYANTDSLHDAGIKVADLMEQSREQIASCLKVKSEEIIFTSGASEANNLALKGIAFKYQHRGRHLIASTIEHSSVNETMKQLRDVFGFEVTFLQPNESGQIEVETLRKAIRPDTILVSIMALNNEVGSLNPIEALAELTHEKSRAFFHSDCTQMLGKHPITFLSKIDLASFSAHKIYGCKGSGFLFKRKNVELLPLINGGQQENGLRGGTSNAPCNIVLAKTLRLSLDSLPEHFSMVTGLNEKLRSLLSELEEVEFNSPQEASPYILNFSFKSITSEIMLNALNEKGFCVSAQSTCSSKAKAPSRVLTAMGFSERRAQRSIRCSLSYLNNENEIEEFVKAIKEILNDYRIKS